MSGNATLDQLLADNHAAVDAFITTAEGVPRRQWTQPLAEEKWSPAQHVHHVALAYEAMARDVSGGERAKLIGTPFKRRLWRLGGLTQILWRRKLPSGATSPREMRPPETSPVPAALFAQLRHAVESFDSALRTAWVGCPNHKVQHPYFGDISLRQALVLIAVHTRHHRAAIAGARRS